MGPALTGQASPIGTEAISTILRSHRVPPYNAQVLGGIAHSTMLTTPVRGAAWVINIQLCLFPPSFIYHRLLQGMKNKNHQLCLVKIQVHFLEYVILLDFILLKKTGTQSHIPIKSIFPRDVTV